MIQIEPIQQTNNELLIATQLEVISRDVTDTSVYAVWMLTMDDGTYVNDGTFQLIEEDYNSYVIDNESIYDYVIQKLNLTRNNI